MARQQISRFLGLLLFSFVVLVFPQQGQDAEAILRLMSERLQKLALVDSVWEQVAEFLPDPYVQQHKEELVEREIQQFIEHQRSLGYSKLPPKMVEYNRKVFREFYDKLAKGFRRQTQIFVQGGGSLVAVKAKLDDKPPLFTEVFYFLDDDCFMEFLHDGRNTGVIRPMDGLDPIWNNLLVRWIFLGGDIVKWGHHRLQKVEREGDIAVLKLSNELSDLEVRISLKCGGAPLNVKWQSWQARVERFQKIGDVWLPALVKIEGKRVRETYRLISAQKVTDPQKVWAQLPLGARIVDVRLGQDRQVNYEFKGKPLSQTQIEQIWQERQAELKRFQIQGKVKEIGKWVPPIFMVVLGFLWYLRMRKQRL